MNARGALGPALLSLVLALPAPDGMRDVRALLREPAASGPEARDRLVARLADLGEDAVPALWSLATGTGLPELIGDDWNPASWCCAPDDVPALCAEALAGASRPAILRHARAVLAGDPGFTERLVLLRLLAALRVPEVVPLALEAAEGIEATRLQSTHARAALRGALAGPLATSPHAWELLGRRLGRGAPAPAIVGVVADAAADAGRSRGMDLLEELLGEGLAENAVLAEAMARLEASRPWDLSGRTLSACRRWWRSQDAAERALVVRLAGRVDGREHVDELIDLLDDGEPLVRRCAQEALEALAGQPVAATPERWTAWHERELAWRDMRLTVLLETLRSPRAGQAVEALRELGEHPFHRHEIAALVADDLYRMHLDVAQSACRLLQGLGSRAALPGLIACLEGTRPQVRAAAWRALVSITGEQRRLALNHWSPLLEG